jgi:hypothetical protein
MGDKVEILEVDHPGHVERVDAAKHAPVRDAVPAVPAADPPGMIAKERSAEIQPRREAAFPGGAKLGWWETTVRLDLEARGLVARSDGSPLRLRRA